MNELFTIPPVLSPRLKWMQANGVESVRPGAVLTLRKSVLDWLGRNHISVSCPDAENEWFALCYEDGKICTDGSTLERALDALVADGADIYGAYPIGCEDVWPTDQQWHATNGVRIAVGDTEDDAITNLAKKLNLRLWNESPGALSSQPTQ